MGSAASGPASEGAAAAGSGPALGPALDRPLDQPVEAGEGERLPRVPARERVGVVGEEGEEVLVRALHRDPDRGGEPPEHRRDRRGLDADQAKGLDRRPDVEHHRAVRPGRSPRLDRLRPGLPQPGRRGRRERPPVPPDEAHRERDVHGRLRRPVRGRGKLLPDPEAPRALLRVVVVFKMQDRGPGLGVPAPELPEVDPRSVLHRRHEVVGGGGRAVVAFEVEVHAAPEPGRAEQGVHHADDLRALVVHREGVEVVDLLVAVGADGMGVGAAVLLELVVADEARVADALDRPRPHVARELLVAEHGEPLLEAQLEPVAAGDAVAGPVVEVLVADDRLDGGVVGVGRRLGVGEDVAGVEDVEPLVLHRPHVEVVDGDDHVEVEVVLEAVLLLIPAHRLLERGHRVAAARDVVRLGVDVKRGLAAGGGGERVFEAGEVARDEGEEVGGLGERVLPAHPVAAVAGLAPRDRVAVREEERVVGPGRAQGGREPREHVGTVRVEGDAPEALRLALGAEDPVRLVEALERSVAAGEDAGADGQGERGPGAGFRRGARGPAGSLGPAGLRLAEGGGEGEDEAVFVEPVLAGGERPSVERRAHQLEPRPVEREGGAGRGPGGAPEREGRGDEAFLAGKVEVEVDRIDQEGRRRVVFEPHLAPAARPGALVGHDRPILVRQPEMIAGEEGRFRGMCAVRNILI